jgi:hypothetical protein
MSDEKPTARLWIAWLALIPVLMTINGFVDDYFSRGGRATPMEAAVRRAYVFYTAPVLKLALPAIGLVIAVILGRRKARLSRDRASVKWTIVYASVQLGLVVIGGIIIFIHIVLTRGFSLGPV